MTTGTITLAQPVAQPAVKTAARAISRVLYIDNLRVLLAALAVLHHFAIIYGATGGFYYEEQGSQSPVRDPAEHVHDRQPVVFHGAVLYDLGPLCRQLCRSQTSDGSSRCILGDQVLDAGSLCSRALLCYWARDQATAGRREQLLGSRAKVG